MWAYYKSLKISILGESLQLWDDLNHMIVKTFSMLKYIHKIFVELQYQLIQGLVELQFELIGIIN